MLGRVVLALAATVTPAIAQSPPELPLGALEVGFGGFTWGTTLEQITAQRGPAMQDTALAIGHRLAYRDQFRGKPALTYYFIHPVDGFNKGMSIVTSPPGRCAQLFEEISKEVSRANPKLRPSDDKTGRRYCEGQILGYWFRNWGDGKAMNIGLSLLASKPEVRVSYEGPGVVRRIEEEQKRADTDAARPVSRTPPAARTTSEDPGYDIDAYCATIAEAAGGSYQLESSCRKQETDALDRFGRLEGVEPRILSYCRNTADIAARSYWFLVTCIGSEEKAKAEMH